MNESLPHSAKRLRLSLACNECRRRKVKCDAAHPKCQNCQTRNSECITTNLRRPGVEVRREWVDLTEQSASSQDGVRSPGRSSFPPTTPHQSAAASTTETTTNRSLLNHEPPGSSTATAALASVSPAQQTYEMPLVRDLSNGKDNQTDRVKLLGGSSSQSLTRSLDVYLKASHIQPVSSGFRHGMRFVEEMEISLTLSLPPLPPLQKCESSVDTFVRRISPLYPIFDNDSLREGIRKLVAMSGFDALPHDEIPMLASAYLVMSLCADEEAQGFTEEGLKYLNAAASLLGHVVLIPYLAAVQTLLLFTVCFRGRNKDGVGWRTLGMAIRISQTLGIHRNLSSPSSVSHGRHTQGSHLVHGRIWAICCSIEKLMQLEVGWPSMTDDYDCNQMILSDSRSSGCEFLTWSMGLARIQGRISHHIYGHSPGDRSSKEILLDTIQLDRELLSWAHSIPESFRPGNDLCIATHQIPPTAFLSIQYYQTMISLHRAALVTPSLSFRNEVDLYFSEDPSKIRLQSGETICVTSARSIANLVIELSDRNIESRLLNAGPSLLACVVLGVSLVKNPGRRLQATDLELLKACVDHTANQFHQCGQHPGFTEGIKSIYKQVHAHIQQRAQTSPTQAQLLHPTVNNSTEQGTAYDTRSHDMNSTHPLHGHPNRERYQVHSGSGTLPSIHNINSSGRNVGALVNATPTHQPDDLVADRAYGQVDLHTELNVPMGAIMGQYDDLNDDHRVLNSDAEPFGNLNLEEIWNWMMIANLEEDRFNS